MLKEFFINSISLAILVAYVAFIQWFDSLSTITPAVRESSLWMSALSIFTAILVFSIASKIIRDKWDKYAVKGAK